MTQLPRPPAFRSLASIGVLTLVSASAPLEAPLATDYTQRASVAFRIEQSLELETVEQVTEIDGEAREGPAGGGDSSFSATLAWTDAWLSDEEGRLTSVRRTFDEVSGQSTIAFLEQANERTLESPFEEAVVLLELEDDEVRAEVEEGDAEEDQAEQLRLELLLDGLLPLEAGESWTVEGDDFLSALGLDVFPILLPAPEPEVEAEGEGRGRGRGRRGGGPGGRGGRTPAELFRNLEWTVELTLEETDEEGLAVIAIEASGEGEPPQPEAGGGRGGRDGGGGEPAEVSGSHTVQLEGALRFDLEAKLPTGLILEGSVSLDSETIRSIGDREMRRVQVQEGQFELTVEVEVTETGDEDEAEEDE